MDHRSIEFKHHWLYSSFGGLSCQYTETEPIMREKTKYFPLFGSVLLISCVKHNCKRYCLRIFQCVLPEV